ncbi:hypothetical protein TNIN_99321 [Trichonephila inaurata madagascariensis]|uniref:Uncharacterized protein n=1 Tax=Trichonephila inaurata madagascariensis TaxID=2747483 RepID=A0A8X6YLA0_9ARAC|nr:hypothetical protein TNIN_99321 [Trichonephila inaurata madagascariensis]
MYLPTSTIASVDHVSTDLYHGLCGSCIYRPLPWPLRIMYLRTSTMASADQVSTDCKDRPGRLSAYQSCLHNGSDTAENSSKIGTRQKFSDINSAVDIYI